MGQVRTALVGRAVRWSCVSGCFIVAVNNDDDIFRFLVGGAGKMEDKRSGMGASRFFLAHDDES